MAAKPINVGDMNIQQLAQAKHQLDQELEILVGSIRQLQAARNKFQESGDCVKRQASTAPNETKGGQEIMSQILVPLTASMYVPGLISNDSKQKFMVDIGTGYYVEKDLSGTLDFFKRKVDFVNLQMEKLIQITHEKNGLRDSLLLLLQTAAASQSAATRVQ